MRTHATLSKNKTRDLTLLVLPGFILLFIFQYVPMFGLVLAFKNYKYDKGILGSDWVGFENFRFFFTSQDAWRVTRNTIGYNLVFIFTIVVGAIILAILLNEVRRRVFVKFYQTVMFFPYFMSWAVIAIMTYAFFNMDFGILNRLLLGIGKEPVMWYSEAKYWIYILPILNFWKGIGYNVIIIYAGLMAIDPTLYESATVDGANRFQMAVKITIPLISPLIVTLTLVLIGNIFYSDFGLFYMVPMNTGILYPVTDVIDTYVYRSLKVTGNIGMSAAVGFYQSVVGFLVVVFSNLAIRKFDKDSAMF